MVYVDPLISSQLIALAFMSAVMAVEEMYYFCRTRISAKIQAEVAKTRNYVNLDLMSNYDKQKAKETKVLLEEIFGKPVQKKIRKLTPEARIEKLCEFTVRAAELYDVTIDKVSFVESDKVYGTYIKDRREIVLNMAYFLSDKWDIQREMLDTIIHEYRHAIQFAVLEQIDQLSEEETENPWEVSLERAKRWMYHFMDYTEASKIPMEYSTNQLEVDARTFAYICLEGV